MTVAEGVRARILSLAAVTALVGQRVYTTVFPQDVPRPAVRVQRISEFETTHLRGAGGLRRARVQVDAVATTQAAAFALDAAIEGPGDGTGLAGFQGLVSNNQSPPETLDIRAILPDQVRDGYDPQELRHYRVMRDYWVTFRTV